MKKISIIYGELKNGVQKKAVEVLGELLLAYTLEYPTCLAYDEGAEPSDALKIYIGTKENNPVLRAVCEKRADPCGGILYQS